jgi:uncharacterized membrane protein YhhN
MSAARWALAAAVAAGTSYVAGWFLPLPAPAAIAWKGAGVGLLAVYAALGAKGRTRIWLAAILAFGALGDVLLETSGLIVGAFAFLAGHLTAIAFYLSRRRADLRRADWGFAAALVAGVTALAWALPPDRSGAGLVALYTVGLSAMAAAAWLSRFPRALTAAGALMFVASDLLIFLRTGRPALDGLAMGLAVWGLYFGGQTLIAVGVVRDGRAPAGGELAPAGEPMTQASH